MSLGGVFFLEFCLEKKGNVLSFLMMMAASWLKANANPERHAVMRHMECMGISVVVVVVLILFLLLAHHWCFGGTKHYLNRFVGSSQLT